MTEQGCCSDFHMWLVANHVASFDPRKGGKIRRYNRLQNLTGIIPKSIAFWCGISYN